MLIFSKLLTALNAAYRWALVAGWTILTSIRCDTWSSLPADAPEGTLAYLPRLCGHGRFIAIKEATRWAVLPGQAPISDAGIGSSVDGYDLTASGTASVPLVSYTIPAGMIGRGEQWAASVIGGNRGVLVGGSDDFNVIFDSLGVAPNSSIASTSATNAGRQGRGEGRFLRGSGTTFRRSTLVSFTNGFDDPGALDLGVNQNVSAVAKGGAATNTLRIAHWAIWRIA